MYEEGTCRECRQRGKLARRAMIERLWSDGLKVRGIAEAVGLSQRQVKRLLQELRREGREVARRQKAPLDRAVVTGLVRAGLSDREIAEQVEARVETVALALWRWRKRGHDIPYRRAGAADPAELERLWVEGLSAGEIAERFGYANAKSVTNRISRLRGRGYRLPYRRRGASRRSARGRW